MQVDLGLLKEPILGELPRHHGLGERVGDMR